MPTELDAAQARLATLQEIRAALAAPAVAALRAGLAAQGASLPDGGHARSVVVSLITVLNNTDTVLAAEETAAVADVARFTPSEELPPETPPPPPPPPPPPEGE